MLKKVIVSILTVVLLGQNMLFAQETAALDELRNLQQQANEAVSKLQGIKIVTAVSVSAIVGSAIVGGIAYIAANKNRVMTVTELMDAQEAFMKALADAEHVTPTFYAYVKEVGEMSELNQDEQVIWLTEELQRLEQRVKKNSKTRRNIWTRWAEAQTRRDGQYLFTENEAWMLEKISTDNDILSRDPRKLIPALKDLALNGTKTSKALTRVLLKRGGITLGLVFVFVAASHAAPDGKMAQRIMDNPKLFLNADEAGLQEIAQNQKAVTFVRAYTKGLETLAALPQADREKVLSACAKEEQQVRRQISSLRPVNAR